MNKENIKVDEFLCSPGNVDEMQSIYDYSLVCLLMEWPLEFHSFLGGNIVTEVYRNDHAYCDDNQAPINRKRLR